MKKAIKLLLTLICIFIVLGGIIVEGARVVLTQEDINNNPIPKDSFFEQSRLFHE